MLKSIKIENLRSLKDTDYIELKPLNILLGANSSGKSTFLRSFPLLTQSVRKELRGPISWFDDSLVDFGDYNTAFNKYASADDRIKFSFRIESPYSNRRFYHSFPGDYIPPDIIRKLGVISFTMSLANDQKGTYIDELIIEDDYNKFSIHVNSRGDFLSFKFNGRDIETNDKWIWDFYTSSFFLPRMIPQKVSGNNMGGRFSYKQRERVYSIIRQYCSPRFKNNATLAGVISHWSPKDSVFLQYLQNQTLLKMLRKNVQAWTTEDDKFKEVFANISILFYTQILYTVDEEISNFFLRTSYIAPMRAEGSRYYRSQGLQVNDIDPYGKNLEEFIMSLSPKQRADYNSYVKRILNVKISVKSTANYNSLELESDGGSFNLTDVGFGYSQIIPIITKLWFSDYQKRRGERMFSRGRLRIYDTDLLTAIEQPELHLHPAYQAKIADVFMSLLNNISEQDDYYKLIVETHSPTIINRIGRRIREGKFKKEDVNIILFQKDSDNKNTIVRQTSYNDKGQIMNWPYGFFDPGDDNF